MRLRLWNAGCVFSQRLNLHTQSQLNASGSWSFAESLHSIGPRLFSVNGFATSSKPNYKSQQSPVFLHSSRHIKSRGLVMVGGNKSFGLYSPRANARSFHPGPSDESFIFRQLVDNKSYTYTYLLADAASREAILIDPVIETVERDFRIVKDLGLLLIAAVNTHVHADHVTGTGELKKRVPGCKSMIAKITKAQADVKLKAGDAIKFGQFELEVRNTPGHTNGCLSYVWHDKGMVFTGDALLIRGCGRTDFQGGSADVLYDSVHNQIFTLPHHFKVFPAHDYTGQTMSTVGEEVQFNPRLKRPKSEFISIMKTLNLPYPKQIDKALPANMVCGIFDD